MALKQRFRKFFPQLWIEEDKRIAVHAINAPCVFDSDIMCETALQPRPGHFGEFNYGKVLMCACGRWKWFPDGA